MSKTKIVLRILLLDIQGYDGLKYFFNTSIVTAISGLTFYVSVQMETSKGKIPHFATRL